MDNVYVQKSPSTYSFGEFLGVIIAATLLVCLSACGSSGSSIAAPAAVTVATPSISVPTGTYTSVQQVTILDATSGSTVYYSTDGGVPTSSSTPYKAPFPISVS